MRKFAFFFLPCLLFMGSVLAFPATKENVGSLEALAVNQIFQEQYDEAYKTLKEAYEKAPRQPGIHFHLGRLFELTGNLEEAIKEYGIALSLDRSLVSAQKGKARCETELKAPRPKPGQKPPTTWAYKKSDPVPLPQLPPPPKLMVAQETPKPGSNKFVSLSFDHPDDARRDDARRFPPPPLPVPMPSPYQAPLVSPPLPNAGWQIPVAQAAPPATPARPAPTGRGGRFQFSGKFNVDIQNRKEKYWASPSSYGIPNNFNQYKLNLKYQFDKQNSLSFEERFIFRKRTEAVVENLIALGYLYQRSENTALSLRDQYNTVFYHVNKQRSFDDNLLEASWLRKYGRFEFLTNLGLESRAYSNYLPADFNQVKYKTDNNYFFGNGTLAWGSTWDLRRYENSRNLNYQNYLFAADYNRTFRGNKSELSLSNVIDSRLYNVEATNLFRTNYNDNYFTLRYDFPVNRQFLLKFEDEYQVRAYPGSFLQGYSLIKIKTSGKWDPNPETRLKLSHEFIYNDENTRGKAHRNHVIDAIAEKRFTETLKMRLEDQYHRRESDVGNIMDFSENLVNLKATWTVLQNFDLTWKNEYLSRTYTSTFYSDYNCFTTGILAAYTKPKKFDFTFTQDFRTVNYRNGGGITTPWTNAPEAYSELRMNYRVHEDLKLKFLASIDKTFNKAFDPIAQEMLWNFALPRTISELSGGFELQFD